MSRAWLAAATLCLSACATPLPPAAPTGLADLLDKPGERALFDAMRAYDEAQYPAAETALKRALAAGLQSARDVAAAHKLLAFITCTSERLAECEAAFVAARKADARFVLSRSEAGHPLWGPVYRRVLPQ